MKRTMSAVLAGLLLSASGAPPVSAHEEVLRFTVDVAEDFSKFVPTMVSAGDTEPKRGSWFVTEGRIFPGGTIVGDGSTFDPTSAGAIGTWLCRGTHLISLSEILQGLSPWVVTHQAFMFPDDKRMLTTDGIEGSEPVVRAVTGATGRYRGLVGEQRQTLLGFNATGGVNLRITFVLHRR